MNTQTPLSQPPTGEVQALMQKYSADSTFKTEFDAASTCEDAVRIAARHGITVSTQDIAALGGASSELSDDTLDRVSGGNVVTDFNFTLN
jgi:predicted ribosomally synthesized peptide with nif11-like leader